MSFKDALSSDIRSVFLNPDEFAEEICLNGVRMYALVDDSQGGFAGGQVAGLKNASGLGLGEADRTLYVPDMPETRLSPGEQITLNGEAWVVDDAPGSVRVEMGIVAVRLLKVWG